MEAKERVMQALVDSRVFKAYRTAFHHATGIELQIEPAEAFAHCDTAAADDPVVIQNIREGVYRAQIPILDGKQLVGVLCTAPLADTVMCHGVSLDDYCPVDGGRGLRRFPLVRFLPYLTLLKCFAEQLGDLSNRLIIHQEHCEPAAVVKARQFVHARIREHIELREVAQFTHVSTFYLCKLFKRTTGLNFRDYVTRLRVEAAKELLRNPSLRISDVALEVGFRSLSHFNRVFRKIINVSPREYRRGLLCSARELDGAVQTNMEASGAQGGGLLRQNS